MSDNASRGQTHMAQQKAWAMHLHELRTPLTVVVGRVQLLRRRLRLGQEPTSLEDDLEAIEAALVRLTAAIERLDKSRDDS